MGIRILIYTHAFAPKIGGVESAVMSLATGLARLSRSGTSGTSGVTVVTPTPRGDFNDASLPFDVVRQPTVLRLIRLTRTADVIHLAGPCFFPLLAGLLLGNPVVVEHHGFQTICPNGQLLHEPTRTPCPGHFMAGRHMQCLRCNAKNGLVRSVTQWLFTFPRRWLCAHARMNIMPTDWLSGLLQLPKSTTVHHGIPSGHHEPIPTSAASSTFAFVGRLVSTKGLHTLLQAAETVRAEGLHFRIKVIGEGPDRDSLERQVAAFGLTENVKLFGHVTQEDLEKHLADVSTIVMPSLAGEVFGLVAAENMARGKLVISSDVGAMREVIGDTGLWFTPGDSGSLAQCIREVLRDSTLASRLGHNAQGRAAEHFGLGQMLLKHVDVYRAAIG